MRAINMPSIMENYLLCFRSSNFNQEIIVTYQSTPFLNEADLPIVDLFLYSNLQDYFRYLVL